MVVYSISLIDKLSMIGFAYAVFLPSHCWGELLGDSQLGWGLFCMVKSYSYVSNKIAVKVDFRLGWGLTTAVKYMKDEG